MSADSYSELIRHYGHNIVVARYTDQNNEVANVSIECETCYEVLTDYDKPERTINDIKRELEEGKEK